MNTRNQPDIITPQWLYARGYTMRQAAAAIKRSHTHVNYVLTGKRNSKTIITLLRKLPARPFPMRSTLAVK